MVAFPDVPVITLVIEGRLPLLVELGPGAVKLESGGGGVWLICVASAEVSELSDD